MNRSRLHMIRKGRRQVPFWRKAVDNYQGEHNTASIIMNANRSSQSLSPPALYQQVAEQLRKKIFAHELLPGAWLDEQSLAADYGISRTPLREALKVLASEGLVVLKPRRGCYVTQLSEQDLDAVFPVMAMLEGMVAAEAAKRLSSADLEILDALHAELEHCARTNNPDGFFEANQRFHAALIGVTGNQYLAQLIDDARKFIKLTRRDSLRLAGRITQSLVEHREILAALRAKDSSLAGRLMHDHLLSGRAAIARLASESN
jgi:DNA-binding GntR family transcriptional regulator